eukprot:364440-Chlamydomonas_euryale.AAC.2
MDGDERVQQAQAQAGTPTLVSMVPIGFADRSTSDSSAMRLILPMMESVAPNAPPSTQVWTNSLARLSARSRVASSAAAALRQCGSVQVWRVCGVCGVGRASEVRRVVSAGCSVAGGARVCVAAPEGVGTRRDVRQRPGLWRPSYLNASTRDAVCRAAGRYSAGHLVVRAARLRAALIAAALRCWLARSTAVACATRPARAEAAARVARVMGRRGCGLLIAGCAGRLSCSVVGLRAAKA